MVTIANFRLLLNRPAHLRSKPLILLQSENPIMSRKSMSRCLSCSPRFGFIWTVSSIGELPENNRSRWASIRPLVTDLRTVFLEPKDLVEEPSNYPGLLLESAPVLHHFDELGFPEENSFLRYRQPRSTALLNACIQFQKGFQVIPVELT